MIAVGLVVAGLYPLLSLILAAILALFLAAQANKWYKRRKPFDQLLVVHEWRCDPDSKRLVSQFFDRLTAVEKWSSELEKEWKSIEATLSPDKFDDWAIGTAVEVVPKFKKSLESSSVDWEGRLWTANDLRKELLQISKLLQSE